MAWGPPWGAIGHFDDEGLAVPWLSPEEVRLNQEMDAAVARQEAEAEAYRCSHCGKDIYSCFCPDRV